MGHSNCLICQRIDMIKSGSNPYFVAELETGYVVVGDFQLFKGYTLFLCKRHETELFFLDEAFKNKFLMEMSEVAAAVHDAFHPDKLNYEMLGNGDAHMHWHLFPRRSDDPVNGPVWWVERAAMTAEAARPDPAELDAMKRVLFAALRQRAAIVKKGDF
ncbi:MAG: HIT family protein [Sporolactobacillus sp.]